MPGDDEGRQSFWRKITEPAFLWGAMGAVVFYVWTASAERERMLGALQAHGERITSLEVWRRKDEAETAARAVADAAGQAELKATLAGLRASVEGVSQNQRDLEQRMRQLIDTQRDAAAPRVSR